MYTSSIIWKDACVDLYQKYQEHSTLGECTQVKIGPSGRAGLFARLDLPATCLLERYVGEVIDGAEFARQPRNDLHVFLYDYGAGKLYVDSNATGSLTRFIRKVEPEDADINCVIIPINLDGAWQLFVELQREIKARRVCTAFSFVFFSLASFLGNGFLTVRGHVSFLFATCGIVPSRPDGRRCPCRCVWCAAQSNVAI